MDSMDRLKRDLQDGPLTRNGFNDQLRRRIEENLDGNRTPDRRRPIWFGRAAAGAALLMVLIAAIWQLPVVLEHNRVNDGKGGETAANADLGNATMAAETGINSAVLIGLRQDHNEAGRLYSTYRTILFAPEGEELKKIAEGPGLLVPYGRYFWRVVPSGGNGAGGMLTMYPAESEPPQPSPAVKDTGIFEKVLFAGNKYVAVQQTVKAGVGSWSQAWVKEMRQLQGQRNPQLTGTPAEPHVGLLINGDEPAAVDESQAADSMRIENWTVQREPGAWVVAAAAGQQGDRLQTKVLSNQPGWDIVNDDFLTVSWDAVKAVQPAAADVFSSKMGDVAAVVTDRNLVVYAVKGGRLVEPEITVPLQPRETVVMAQWARKQLNIDYVDIWKNKAGPLLGGAESAHR